jgi:hypothetical protein
LYRGRCHDAVEHAVCGIWDAGYADTRRALERAPRQDKVDPLEGVIAHGPIPDPTMGAE